MNLQSLVGKNLDRVVATAEEIQRLLDGAARHIADAKVTAISGETRFVSAYTAIRMLADIGLNANGYRTRSSVPGHHLIAIRAMEVTLGIAAALGRKAHRTLAHLRTVSAAAPPG
jgi:hypothetical protein